MSSVAKRVAIRLVILAIAGGILYGLSQVVVSSEAKHFRISHADVSVQVQPDASLHVIEELRFEFTGDFSGAFREIPLAEGVRVTNVSVSEAGEDYRPGGNTALGSFDEPGTFGARQVPLEAADGGPTAGFHVVWHYSALDETRTFTIEYDVTGGARAYDDVVDVPWAVWGSQWDFWLDELDAEIRLTNGDAQPVEGWVRPRKLDVDPELAPGSASIEAERLRPGDETVLRAVFPRDAFPSVDGASVRPGPGLETVEAEEAAVDDDEGLADKLAGFVGSNIVLLEVIWTALVVGIAMALYAMGRDRRSSVARYVSEPPEDIPPALAFALAEEGKFDDRLVVATLLDLVDRGYYEGRASEGEALDLRVSIPAERPDGAELTEYERETIEFFDGLLEDGPSDLGKLKDRVPQHSSSWRTRWEDLRQSLDRAEEGEMEWDRDLTGARTVLALVALAGYIALGLAYWDRTHLVAIPIFATVAGMLFIYLLPASWLKRLDPASRERHAQWNAFERWTRDFPRLSDDPPATLTLWRRILVYAVAFGTAERVIASGRIPEPVMREATTSGVWLVPHLGGVHSGVTPSFDGFASSFTSQVAPQSSSSGGGGGGFSGGGGGFSGGGGGGAW
jgi:uncharacterized membrane protein